MEHRGPWERSSPLPQGEIMSNLTDKKVQLVHPSWTPKRRAWSYGTFLVFALIGAVLWPMGMHILSNFALFWTVGIVWAFGFSCVAFWTARREAAARRRVRYLVGTSGWDPDPSDRRVL